MAIDLYYGDTVSGKTTAMAELARYLWETKKLKTRAWIGDGGAESLNRSGGVDEGWIEVVDPIQFDYPMTVLKLIADGYFPKDWRDPNSKLVAPTLDHYTKYGLHIYEGTTVFGQWLLEDRPGGLAWQAAMGSGFGGVKDEEENLAVEDAFKGVEGGSAYQKQGTNAPKHFAIAQRKLVAAIRASKKFPGMTIWSAHPTEGPDRTEGGESGQYGKITGKKIIGPDVGGKAQASLIGKEFGNLLHFDSVTLKDKEKDDTSKKDVQTLDREYRLYTRRHYDPNVQVLTEYVAGNRCALPAMLPDYFVSKDPGDSILQFYSKLTEARTVVANQKKGSING